MTITHEMNTQAFRHYLDRADIPCKEDIWSLWTEIVAKWPAISTGFDCGWNNEEGTQITMDVGERVLQLYLWPDGGEVFWLDRNKNKADGDEERQPMWREAFLERIPWLLGEGE